MTVKSGGRPVVFVITLASAFVLLAQPFAHTAGTRAIPDAAGIQSVRGDTDGDGIPDDRDHCQQTPERAVAIASGCAPIEIVAHPEIIGAGAQASIQVALLTLEGVDQRGGRLFGREADGVRADLAQAQRQLGRGLLDIGGGDVCEGAGVIAEGRGFLEAASRGMGDVVLADREALQRTVSPDDPDADAAEVTFHELGYRGSLVGNALTAGRSLDETVQTLCDQVIGEIPTGGIVAATNDAARIVQLRDGHYFALAADAGAGPVYEGARIRIDGARFADGTGVAQRVVALGDDQIDPSSIPAVVIKCMRLNIAPLQPFNPPLPISGPYVLHEPSGYMSTVGFLVLDAPMRLAARSGGCPTVPPGDGDGKVQTFRYSLKLEFKKDDAASFTVIAPDLTASDDPVTFPASALPSQADPVVAGILRATAQGQACIGFPPKGMCSSTVKVLSMDEYPVLIFRHGALASANYATRFFDLEDWDTSGFRVAEVASLTVHPFVSSGASVGFDAEGYSSSGALITEHITLPGNPFFAIRQSDFVGPGILFPVASEGTDQRSGLRWPRAVGYRNGHPFWYTATLPNVVRDLVDFCNPGPRSFYRLPWTDGLQVGVGQGNNTAFSHNGSQAFAFDVSLTDGQTIRAIRGGTVEWLQESQTAVFNPNQPISPSNQPFPNGSLQNWGNAVRIAHQDGTFAWYFHIKTNGVTVNKDEQVQRGQPIAQADNTGRSTGTHLHFQVQADNINWGQSIQIRFDTANLGGCYIPQTGDSLISNNANPNF